MKLKPCPFCGGVVCYEISTVRSFRCQECDGVFILQELGGSVLERWNQRHNEPPIIDEVPNLDSQKR